MDNLKEQIIQCPDHRLLKRLLNEIQ